MARRLLFVLGTRPEAIKLAPVILRARACPERYEVVVCVTAQHRRMLDQALELFGIAPDVDLDLMRPDQDLFELTASVLTAIKPVLRERRADWVLVQGDTTTAWTAALGAFYAGVRVGHVEAGLRTFDPRQPFPEEINRRLCAQLADLHFAPTQRSRLNLLRENVADRRILVTGNTVVDALQWVLGKIEAAPTPGVLELRRWARERVGGDPVVLITGHRRESFGEGFENICAAIAELAAAFPRVQWVYPVHLNPRVQGPVRRALGGAANVHLLEPLEYAAFAWLMTRSTLILTDSGGIQEEAVSLGKPVLVMRNTTERPEGVEVGGAELVGNRRERIVGAVGDFLRGGRPAAPASQNPFGDGQAAGRILQAIDDFR